MERIGGTPTQPVYELKTEGPVEIGCVVLREDLTHGQRVEGFRILGIDEETRRITRYSRARASAISTSASWKIRSPCRTR